MCSAGPLPEPIRFTGRTEADWSAHLKAVDSCIRARFNMFEACAQQLLSDEWVVDLRFCAQGSVNSLGFVFGLRHGEFNRSWETLLENLAEISQPVVVEQLLLLQQIIVDLFIDFHQYFFSTRACMQSMPKRTTKPTSAAAAAQTLFQCNCGLLLPAYIFSDVFHRKSSPDSTPFHPFWLQTERLTEALRCVENISKTQHIVQQRARDAAAGAARLTSDVSTLRIGSYNVRSKICKDAVKDVMEPIAEMLHQHLDLVALQELSAA